MTLRRFSSETNERICGPPPRRLYRKRHENAQCSLTPDSTRAATTSDGWALVDDEQLRARARARAMRFRIVGNLIAHAWPKHERAAVGELGVQLAFEAEKDVPFDAPVILAITRRILDHAHADIAERLRAPVRDTLFAGVLGWFDAGPVGGAERDGGDVHGILPSNIGA